MHVRMHQGRSCHAAAGQSRPRQRLVPLALARARQSRPASPPPPAAAAAPAAPSAAAAAPLALASLPLPPRGLPPGYPHSEKPSLLERALEPLGLSDMAAFVQRPAAFLGDRRRALGPVFAAENILLKPTTVFLFDERDVRRALAAEHRLVEQRWPKAFAALLGPSFQGGKQRHAFHRRAMGAAFTAEAIAAYQPFLQQLIERRLERSRLGAEEALERGQGDGTFPAWTENHVLAFDVAATLLLGFGDLGEESVRELHDLFREFVQGFVLSPPLDLPLTRYGRALRARRRIVEVLSRHLEPVMARVAAEEAEGAGSGVGERGGSGGTSTAAAATTALRAFLTARDDDGRRVTLEEAKEIVLFVAFAGHETTGTSVSQALRLLDAHRDQGAWRRLVEEQRRVVARHGPALTAAAAADMPYADAVAREALRLCPVVRFVWREALEDFEVGGGDGAAAEAAAAGGATTTATTAGRWRVPAGAQVVCSLSQPIDDIPLFAHDRDAFRPERWLEEVVTPPPRPPREQGEEEEEVGPSPPPPDALASPWRLLPAPGGYLPFGAGGRVCLGLPLAMAEMRAFLAVMARKYEFEVRWPGGEPWEGKATEAGFLVPGDMPVRLWLREVGEAAEDGAAADWSGVVAR